MSERTDRLARRILAQVEATAAFLGTVDECDLRLPCADEGRDATVAAVVGHAIVGWRRAALIFRSVAAAPAQCASGRPGAPRDRRSVAAPSRGMSRRPDAPMQLDPASAVTLLRAHGEQAAAQLRRLADEQLGQPLPVQDARIVDIGKPLSLIVEYMLYQQGAHLDTMRSAVAADRRHAQRKRRARADS